MWRDIAPGLSVYEAPLRFAGGQIGRRMVVVSLPGDELLLISPAPRTDAVEVGLRERGTVRFGAAASKLHGHLSLGDYPEAELIAAPGLREHRDDLVFAGDLGSDPEPRWAATLDQAEFKGNRYATEVVFLHRASASLIVGDCVWNVARPLPRTVRFGTGGHGLTATRAFRLFTRRRQAQASALRILEWNFERVIVGHGPILETGGRAAFARAWRVPDPERLPSGTERRSAE